MTSPSAPHAQSTILVVDDNPENLTVLSGVLRSEYRVRVATDGTKAIRIIESDEPPDLVLLDVMMPGLSGFEVCAHVKANAARRDIPIVFVTALDEIEDERRGLDLGAIDYITKPISPSIVLARVRNHLELKYAREALARQNVILEAKVAERTADLVRANEELKESFLESIDLAYGVMSEADEFLASHCKRVAYYAHETALVLGIEGEAAFDVQVAAQLHDIGLVGLRREELKRLFRLPSPTAAEEPRYWAHPVADMRVLSTSARFTNTAKHIAGHHENLDGTGFPARAKADAIGLGSRILAAADRWDLYVQLEEPTRGHELNFETFTRRQQNKLDPRVIEALHEVLQRGDPFSRSIEASLPELRAGMVVARTIRNAAGAVLLSAGTRLRKDHIADLGRIAAQGNVQLPIRVYPEETR